MPSLVTTSHQSKPARMPGAPAAARRRRVLFTMVELGPGGVETNVLNLLHRLDPQRFDLSLFLHHDPASSRHAAPRSVPSHVAVRSALQGAYRRWKLPYALGKFMQAARRCDVIVAAQEGRATLVACLAAAVLRKPVIGCIQFDWASAGQRMRKRQQWGLKWLCPRMERVVACGDDSAASLRRIAHIETQRLTVIPNFVESDRVHARARKPLPSYAGTVFAKPTIVAMGRLNEQKGFDVLIRAHALMIERGVECHLLIVGEGPLRGDLESLARKLGVANTVFMPGFDAEPFAALQLGTVFALPSRFEGLPFALIEAMTLGLPVVASDCPSGPGEVLARGKHGLLVPVDDAVALADALSCVLRDPVKRASLSELSRRRAREYSDSRAIPAWEDLLEAAC